MHHSSPPPNICSLLLQQNRWQSRAWLKGWIYCQAATWFLIHPPHLLTSDVYGFILWHLDLEHKYCYLLSKASIWIQPITWTVLVHELPGMVFVIYWRGSEEQLRSMAHAEFCMHRDSRTLQFLTANIFGGNETCTAYTEMYLDFHSEGINMWRLGWRMEHSVEKVSPLYFSPKSSVFPVEKLKI